MTIRELDDLLFLEVTFAIKMVKKRSLYNQASQEVKARINQDLESQVVRWVMNHRYFDEQIKKRDLLISEEDIDSMITISMTNNFSIFSGQ
jgi:protoheme ferro-lyase